LLFEVDMASTGGYGKNIFGITLKYAV